MKNKTQKFEDYEEFKSFIKSVYPITLKALNEKFSIYKAFIKKEYGKRWNEVLLDCDLRLNMNRADTYSKADILLDAKLVYEKFGNLNTSIYRANRKIFSNDH